MGRDSRHSKKRRGRSRSPSTSSRSSYSRSPSRSYSSSGASSISSGRRDREDERSRDRDRKQNEEALTTESGKNIDKNGAVDENNCDKEKSSSRHDNQSMKRHKSSSSRRHRDGSHSRSRSRERKRRDKSPSRSYDSKSDERDRDRKHRRRSRSRSRSRSGSNERDRHRSRKHRHKSRKRDSKRHKRDRDDRKKSKKRKKEKRRRYEGEKSSKKRAAPTASTNTFGKYGIIKESDFYSKQRDFEVWMAEVKKIPAFNGPKWELMNYFKEFCEDHNTATMPHEKYYNYEKWEMEEYMRNKDKVKAKGGAISDEAQHLAEIKRKKEEEKLRELEMVRGSMNKEKVEEMKRQAMLKQEMTLAYKTGNEDKRKKLQKRLEPDDVRR